MNRRGSARTGRWVGRGVTLTAVLFVVLWGSVAALAHHKPDHAGGPPAARAGAITEDNDSDGVPNTPDPVGDSDNRHPSGKDKHAESGGSGNQGNAASEPDANGSGPEDDQGGLDQPGGPGGMDTLDQDGNNGCGNDDDFEDDNEGNCGGKKGQAPPPPPPPPPPPCCQETPPPPPGGGGGGSVAGQVLGGVAGGGNQGGALGQGLNAPAAAAGPSALAFTGLEVFPLVVLAVTWAILGGLLTYLGRRRSIRG
jgi:hypothetical protein